MISPTASTTHLSTGVVALCNLANLIILSAYSRTLFSAISELYVEVTLDN